MLALVAVLSCGDQRAGRGKPPDPPRGTVVGRVVDQAGTGQAGAAVILAFEPASDRVPIAEISTAADGRFAIEAVPDGHYRLTARARGQSDATVKLQVDAGERLVSLLRLGAGQGVRGVVQDRRGRPVPSARVLAWPRDSPSLSPAEAVTDAAGAFSVEGLGRGAHHLLAEAPGLGSLELADLEVPTRGIVLKLDGEGHTISGLVVVAAVAGGTKSGSAAGARVLLGGEGGEGGRPPREVKVAADGSFALHGLGAGRYVARASLGALSSPTRPIVVNAGGSPPPVRLELRPGPSIAGRVVDEAGGALPGADVEIEAVPPDDLPERGRADASGGFSLGPLPPGEYRISARRTGYVLTESPRISLPAVPNTRASSRDGKAGITLTLARAGRLSGLVLDERGRPVAGAAVGVLRTVAEAGGVTLGVLTGTLPTAAAAAALPGRVLAAPGRARKMVTDRAGRFDLVDSVPGTVRLEITHPEALPLQTAALTVEPGRVVDAGVFKLRAGSLVTGRVIDENESPIDQVRVTATAAEAFAAGAGAAATVTAHGDRYGQFGLRLAEGVYRLEISAPGHNIETVSVQVPGGSATPPVAVRLARADATLEGTVRDAADGFVGRAEVLAFVAPPEAAAQPGAPAPPAAAGLTTTASSASALALASTTTDGGGRFRMDRLPRRPLIIQVRHADYPHVRQFAHPGTHAVVRLPIPGGIAGEVREKGTGAFVARYRLTAEGPDGRTAIPARTTGAGFELERLAPGRWTITVLAPGFFRGMTAVDVPPGALRDEPSVRDLRVELEREPR